MNYGTNEITLLSEEQVFGSNKIDVIEQLGGKCAITDFAILLGAGTTDMWYLLSSDGDGHVCSVLKDGSYASACAGTRSGGIRPVLPFSDISDISKNEVRGSSGFLEVEYGEYPQYVVDDANLRRSLYRAFASGLLKKTGKYYTTDSRRWDANSKSFKEKKHYEYEYGYKKYVRVKSNRFENDYKLNRKLEDYPNEFIWVEVAPITWYVDEKSKLLVSKKLLASGIRFCNDGEYNGDFKTTEMYMFLNKYFAKDIGHSVICETKPEEKVSEEEDKKIESLELKDFVLQSIDNLVVNQINNLEPEDQIKYLKEVQDLLNNYTNRNKKLINQDPNEINIDIENYDKIRLDTLKGILDIKERIKEENQKDSQLRELVKESKLLNDRIEELSQLNTEQNNSFSKVKVKTLKENKKDIV